MYNQKGNVIIDIILGAAIAIIGYVVIKAISAVD